MFTTTYPWERPTTYPYYYGWETTTTTTTDDYWDTTTTVQTTTTRPGVKMPKSCCQRDTNYDNNNFMCDYYFTRGCHGPLNSILSESVMMIGSSALIIGVVQVNFRNCK